MRPRAWNFLGAGSYLCSWNPKCTVMRAWASRAGVLCPGFGPRHGPSSPGIGTRVHVRHRSPGSPLCTRLAENPSLLSLPFPSEGGLPWPSCPPRRGSAGITPLQSVEMGLRASLPEPQSPCPALASLLCFHARRSGCAACCPLPCTVDFLEPK